jgi:predicted esterase
MRVARVLVLAAALVAVAAPGLAATRADLSVPSAHIKVTDGRLSGTFVVHVGGHAVRRTSASLGVRVGRHRVAVARFVVGALRPGASRTIVVHGRLPSGLPIGTRAITACADSGRRVRERSEANNCRRVATLSIGVKSSPPPPTAPAAPPADPSASSVPGAPVPFTKNTVFQLQSSASPYWAYVPSSYDATHATPTTLLVWLHGCTERSPERILDASPGGSQSWITIAPGGRENDCWHADADAQLVLAAIADVKQHFNIAPRRVVVGGFSAGGDLAYRLIYDRANDFAGLLAEGTTPFKDTGCPSREACIARAAWKANIVHVAHTSDEAYDIATVREETDALKAAGFPITRIERAGRHNDPDTGDTGAVHDLRTYLLPHLDDPWLAPAR